MTVIQYQTICF